MLRARRGAVEWQLWRRWFRAPGSEKSRIRGRCFEEQKRAGTGLSRTGGLCWNRTTIISQLIYKTENDIVHSRKTIPHFHVAIPSPGESPHCFFLSPFALVPLPCAVTSACQVFEFFPQLGDLLQGKLLLMNGLAQSLLVWAEFLQLARKKCRLNIWVASVQEQKVRDVVRLNLCRKR